MNITAGTARGIPLKAPKERTLRPTQNQVRLALFSILESTYLGETMYEGLRVGDFFAGIGALGIETLSRGVDHATFIEGNKKHAVLLTENLTKAKFEHSATIIVKRITSNFRMQNLTFDILFLDPPYEQFNDIQLSNFVPFLSQKGILIYLHDKRNKSEEKIGNKERIIHLRETRVYGATGVSFYTD